MTEGAFEYKIPVAFTTLTLREVFEGERRLEGETYLTGGFQLRKRLAAANEALRQVGDAAKVWQPDRLKGVGVSQEHGVPFLTATQTFDIRPVPRKFLAPSRTPQLNDRLVKPGWILLTRSGSVGDAIVSGKSHDGMIISDDLLRVEVKAEQDWGYFYAFFRSWIGRTMLRSTKYGSIIKHLESHHVAGIPLPNVGDDVRSVLLQRMKRVCELRDQAYERTMEAEALFEKAIAFKGAAENEVFATSATAVQPPRYRLEAAFHRPAVRSLLGAIKKAGTTMPLSAVSESAFGVKRFKHHYRTEGIAYLDSEDLFKINPEITKFIPSGAKKDAKDYFVKKGWLLMASSGQLYGLNGNVVLANHWHEGKIVSNHVLRIVPKLKGENAIRPGYLQMALGHPVLGRPLVKRFAFGSEVPEIAAEDLLTCTVVRLDGHVETEIADRVEEASDLYSFAEDEEQGMVDLLEKYLSARYHLSKEHLAATAAE